MPSACAPGSVAPSAATKTCLRCDAGSFQASEGATACTLCPVSAWCAEGSSAPTPCHAGSVGQRLGLSSSSECATCTPGFWCSAGKAIPCPKDTHNNATGQLDQGACVSCPLNSFTYGQSKTAQADCICLVGHYANFTSGNLSCIACPVGANCTAPGATLEHLPIEEGYWRSSSDTTDVRRCRGALRGSSCVGCGGASCAANFTGCKPSTRGPLCALCEEARLVYYDKDAMECRPCNRDGAAVPLYVAGGLLLGVGLLSLVACALKRRRTRSEPPPVHRRRGRGRACRIRLQRLASSVRRCLRVKVKMCATNSKATP